MVCFTSLDSHTQHTKYKKRNSFCCWYAHLRSRKAMYILRFLALSKIKEGKKSSPQKKTKEQRIDPTRMEWRRVFLFCFLRNSLFFVFFWSRTKSGFSETNTKCICFLFSPLLKFPLSRVCFSIVSETKEPKGKNDPRREMSKRKRNNLPFLPTPQKTTPP